MMRRLLFLLVFAVCALPSRTAAVQDTAAEPSPAAQSSRGRNSEREGQDERISRTVNIGANGEIEISNISGDITISRGGGTSAVIEAIKTVRAASADEARSLLALVQVDIVERGTRAEVRTRYPSGDELRRQNRRNVDVSVAFNIAAPEGTRIIAKSISGSISARDINGGLTLETVSGNVRIANAARTVAARSISGSIEIADTKIDGALEAGTISGSVRLRNMSARNVDLNTVSGELELDNITSDRVGGKSISGTILFRGDLQPNSRYELTSHSGSIRLAIPPSSGFEVEASSFSGSINTDIPITMNGDQPGRRGRGLRGRAGGGGAILDLTTFSGTINITKR
jgi:DUF4097 and DUF4098 domain-containing protein YvlB